MAFGYPGKSKWNRKLPPKARIVARMILEMTRYSKPTKYNRPKNPNKKPKIAGFKWVLSLVIQVRINPPKKIENEITFKTGFIL